MIYYHHYLKYNNNVMRIGIIGLGKVGHLIGSYLSLSHEVIGLDIKKISASFKVATDYKELKDVDLAFIAVPTPYNDEIKSLDTSIVLDVIKKLLEINNHVTIFIKSTMPVFGTRNIIQKVNYHNIFYTPEFFKENDDVDSINHLSRLVFGYENKDERKEELYYSLFKNVKEHFSMVLEEAEAVKLFSNTYLAYRINFFNEIDAFAYDNALNAKTIIKAMSKDPRIGDFYNTPSFGYAGKCLPKDVKATGEMCKNYPNDVMYEIDRANKNRIDSFYHLLLTVSSAFNNPVIGFDTYIDEASSSPLKDIILRLKEKNIPMVMVSSNNHNPFDIKFVNSKEELEKNANIIVDVINARIKTKFDL